MGTTDDVALGQGSGDQGARFRKPRHSLVDGPFERPVIGAVGARRLVAVLVIGNAVLGGVVVAAMVRPDDPVRRAPAITSTTDRGLVVEPEQVVGDESRTEVVRQEPATIAPSPTTTVGPVTPSAPPTTAPTTEPQVAAVTTTAPQTVPPTSVAPSTTAAPTLELDDE